MWQKIKTYFVAHVIGLVLILAGWAFSMNVVAINRFQMFSVPGGGVSERPIFQSWTFFGLALIIIGAYFPEMWIAMRNRKVNPPK